MAQGELISPMSAEARTSSEVAEHLRQRRPLQQLPLGRGRGDETVRKPVAPFENDDRDD